MTTLIALTVLAGVAALVRGVLREARHRHELEQAATARLHQHVGRI